MSGVEDIPAGRPLTAVEFFQALKAGYELPRAPWAESTLRDDILAGLRAVKDTAIGDITPEELLADYRAAVLREAADELEAGTLLIDDCPCVAALRRRAAEDDDESSGVVVEYAVRAQGEVMARTADQADCEARAERYRDCWPDAVVVARAGLVGEWTPAEGGES